MKIFHGRTYLTLAEAEAAYPDAALVPAVLNYDIEAGDVSVNVAALFRVRFADRYIARPIEDAAGASLAAVYMGAEASAALLTFKPYVQNLQTMAAQLVADSEEETLEYKRAPQGATNFRAAFSDGGTVRGKSGASSGNVDRLLRYQNEIRNAADIMLDRLENLFIGIIAGDWGVEEVDV